MGNEHYVFHVRGVTPESRMKIVKPPLACYRSF